MIIYMFIYIHTCVCMLGAAEKRNRHVWEVAPAPWWKSFKLGFRYGVGLRGFRCGLGADPL